MQRLTALLKLTGDRAKGIEAVRGMEGAFAAACADARVKNFSLWHMEEYLFVYGESETGDAHYLDRVLAALPAGVELACAPGSMRLMYHDLGVVREDKALVRHRVFAARLKPGCAEEYKRRHDGLIERRGDKISEGPESNFTIWNGDGCIFGYCEVVRAMEVGEPTPEQHAATVAWETKQLEIMDWITDDMNWLTGEDHPAVERII